MYEMGRQVAESAMQSHMSTYYWYLAHYESTLQPSSIMVASYFGHEGIVKLLLEAKADVESKDKYN
jgi:hypothetical protein